jgi:hypothetical protein
VEEISPPPVVFQPQHSSLAFVETTMTAKVKDLPFPLEQLLAQMALRSSWYPVEDKMTCLYHGTQRLFQALACLLDIE